MKRIKEHETEVVEVYGSIYATFLVHVEKCPVCDQPMVFRPRSRSHRRPIFADFEAQAKSAGLRCASMIMTIGEDKFICEDCISKGELDFLCAMCQERKPVGKKQQDFGTNPSEHLCTDCYETTPAKKWDAKVEELEDSHKYDWE